MRLQPLTQAALYWECHPDTLRRRIRRSELTAFRVKGRSTIYVDLDELDALPRHRYRDFGPDARVVEVTPEQIAGAR